MGEIHCRIVCVCSNVRVKKIASIALAAFGFAVFQTNAFAWGSSGHFLVAAEAYQQLSPELKAQVYEILKAHPDYARWTNAYHPNPVLDVSAYVFMRSSAWPDEIRRSDSQYDHPSWHFIDYPLRPSSFPMEPGPEPTNDILFGIAQFENILSDTNANPELRAASLSWLVHLVGDIHQPLHCASLFTDAYPTGDRGGNEFYVKPADQAVRLHGIWDGLLGASPNTQMQWRYAIALGAKFPRASLAELASHPTPKDWSLESRDLAIEKGYLRGELKGGTNAETAVSLPADYIPAAKAVAERQCALAGYRLADAIQNYLKLGRTVPLLPENTNIVAQTATNKIGTAEADRYYDQTMTVTGRVVQVSVRPNITILSLDKPSFESPFTAVVFQENAGAFKNLESLTNQNVEINGSVTEYRNRPEIILESPDQIKVIGGK